MAMVAANKNVYFFTILATRLLSNRLFRYTQFFLADWADLINSSNRFMSDYRATIIISAEMGMGTTVDKCDKSS